MKVIDQEIAALKNTINEMWALVHQQIYNAGEAMLTGDKELAYKVISREKESILDDIVFEMELVKQVEVNIDYILMLVAKYQKSHCKNKEILGEIDKAIGASPELRSKRELIQNFIENINTKTDVQKDWAKHVKESREKDIIELMKSENLKERETRELMKNAFADGTLKTTGTAIDKILPPMSLFSPERVTKKATVIEKLKEFFAKYLGLSEE